MNKNTEIKEIDDLETLPTYGIEFFFKNMKGYRLLFFFLTLIAVCSTLIGVYSTYLIGDMVNNISTLTVNILLTKYLPIYLVLSVLLQWFGYYTRKYGETLSGKYIPHQSLRFFKSISRIKSDKFNNYSKEKLMNAIDKYLGNVGAFLGDWNWNLPRHITSFLIVLVILYNQSMLVFWINLGYMVGFLALSFSLSYKIAEPIRVYNKQTLDTNSLKQNFYLNIIPIKKLNSIGFFIDYLKGSFTRNIDRLQEYKNYHAKRWLIQFLLFNVIYIFTFFYGIHQVINKELPLGYLFLIQYSYSNLMIILIYFIEYYVILVNQKEDSKILREEFAKIKPTKQEVAKEKVKIWNEIELKDVGFNIVNPKGEEIDIKIPSFQIKKGSKIVIRGESGSGKSTLLNILHNQIEFRGDYKIRHTKYLVSHSAPSTTFPEDEIEVINTADPLFNISLMKNLLLDGEVDQELFELLHEKLKIQEFIKDYLVMVGTEDFNLSSGQLQRIRLMRGLLRTKEVYLLDEPFNGIDNENKREIIEFLKEFLKNKTIIQVVHSDSDVIFGSSTCYSMDGHTLKMSHAPMLER